ncbi:uncharacterized protein LOC132304530 [Cornus florida]|uniref:uncharacterized protein LOC132304530 n=1 Tax=Cornus florida TaxID=4283 RepID=UPI0028A2C995|nr:uncharacterized protein LOC132304530 [Cornus florida]
MGEHTMPGSGEFLPYYQQTATRPVVVVSPPGGELSDPSVVVPTDHVLSPGNPSPTSSSQLNPKGCISKPIRRRTRASRRTPTTLLNADTTNFRALVQQFTGCSSGNSSSHGAQRGPINLSFGETSDERVVSVTSMVASFGLNGYNQQTWPDQQQQQQHLQEQQQQFSQEPHEQVYGGQEQQYSVFSSDNSNIVSDVYFPNDSYFF